mmetsp:Transcript_7439/g.23652  ORF Transcript_7439/g.23652 Transcript_7439/m.23652 type:complete len:270 (-) Transcript_7439:25-834(-)
MALRGRGGRLGIPDALGQRVTSHLCLGPLQLQSAAPLLQLGSTGSQPLVVLDVLPMLPPPGRDGRRVHLHGMPQRAGIDGDGAPDRRRSQGGNPHGGLGNAELTLRCADLRLQPLAPGPQRLGLAPQRVDLRQLPLLLGGGPQGCTARGGGPGGPRGGAGAGSRTTVAGRLPHRGVDRAVSCFLQGRGARARCADTDAGPCGELHARNRAALHEAFGTAITGAPLGATARPGARRGRGGPETQRTCGGGRRRGQGRQGTMADASPPLPP